MEMEKFGEVENVNLRYMYPIGYVLRQQEDGVVLEEYLDHKGLRVDTVHQFGEDLRLDREEDLKKCLKVAREYEPDLENPIFVDVGISSEEEMRLEKEKRDSIIHAVENSRIRPYQKT